MAKTLNTNASAVALITCKWKVHRITNNHTWTAALHKLSCPSLRLMKRKVKEKPAVCRKELQQFTNTRPQQIISNELQHNCVCSYTLYKIPLLKLKPRDTQMISRCDATEADKPTYKPTSWLSSLLRILKIRREIS